MPNLSDFYYAEKLRELARANITKKVIKIDPIKTRRGIVVNKLGDGGLSFRSPMHRNAKNIIITKKDIDANPGRVAAILYNIFLQEELNENPYRNWDRTIVGDRK